MDDFKLIGKDKVSPIGLGTWGMGGKTYPDSSRDPEMVKAITFAVDNGLSLLDTAEFYAQGHTEELVGKAIEKVEREKVFVISKVWYTHLEREQVIRSAENSLKRLNLSYIDLYLIHWPNEKVPLREPLSAMQKLIDDGKIRYAGVSNFDVELLKRAREEIPRSDLVADEVRYSLLYREQEKLLLPYCKRENLAFIAYTPLEKGLVSSDNFLSKIGKKYNKTAAQIALNWLLSNDTIPIPKSEKIDHIKENAGAMGWRLSQEDFAAISTKYG
ncbi:MAG: aldo/keto reductase [Nitrososphaerota archaeon]|jgi:diketogulonate reductase-like aldo/keto reductase|nr:aldo/keto reductase [Nitrososphaerota archaeon]MDG6931586.1 aldo/keto reductase [Nitrososphaerota archaeon]MDG6935997.1 aldo/keto reductase [Nitrososphaerota archaeon]MDG6943949.1 aldo/keto reductase [Nitrososphaerota archaeon]